MLWQVGAALFRHAHLATHSIGAMFPPRVNQFDAVAIVRQEVLGPVLMGGKEPKQASPLRQARKPGSVVVPQPAVLPESNP